MAKPTSFTFSQFWVLIGDGESPEQFVSPCGLTGKAFNQTQNTVDTVVPDCDDPDAPAYIERAVDSLSSEITGSGILANEYLNEWQKFYQDALPRTIRVGYGAIPDVSTGAYYEGRYLLSQFNTSAERGQKTRVQVTMVSDGEWTWVEAFT